MNVLSTSVTLFLIMNSLGLVPLILTLLKGQSSARRKWILFREMLLALVVILFFNFAGVYFFDWLKISDSTLRMAGGLILFLIAIRMIFPAIRKREHSLEEFQGDHLIVPIAIPVVAGPSLLAVVMMLARQEKDPVGMVAAILLSWLATFFVFLFAPLLQKFVRDKGLLAFQRLMGLLLTLIAVQMFLQGMSQFITTSFGGA